MQPHSPLTLLIVFILTLTSCGQQEQQTEEIKAPTTKEIPAIRKEGKTFFMESFDGETIAFSDQGDGVPVFLLHGFLNQGSNWDKSALKPLLIQNGYRVIVPDLRGNGQSSKPQTDEGYANHAESKDLELMADALGLGDFFVVGYSRGSIILTDWMTRDPRIVKALVGGMGDGFLDPEWNRRKAFAAAFDDPPQITEMTSGAVEYARSINADFRSLHLQQKHQPSPDKSALAGLDKMVFVLIGQKDNENGNAMNLMQQFPRSVLDIIPGGDHDNTYKSTEFAGKVLKFLNR